MGVNLSCYRPWIRHVLSTPFGAWGPQKTHLKSRLLAATIFEIYWPSNVKFFGGSSDFGLKSWQVPAEESICTTATSKSQVCHVESRTHDQSVFKTAGWHEPGARSRNQPTTRCQQGGAHASSNPAWLMPAPMLVAIHRVGCPTQCGLWATRAHTHASCTASGTPTPTHGKRATPGSVIGSGAPDEVRGSVHVCLPVVHLRPFSLPFMGRHRTSTRTVSA